MFIVGCIPSQQQTPYRRLHCQSYASSIVAPDEAAEAAGKIAKSSGDSASVPRTKGKEFFSRVTQWRWRSCELKTTIEVTNPVVCVGLRAGDTGWRAARHQAACMFEGQGSQHHVGHFWLAFDWCKQVKQVARSP